MLDRIDAEYRTFESRLLFIEDIFKDRYESLITMTSGIQYKLNASFQQYLIDLNQVVFNLTTEDPLRITKKITKKN